MERRVAGKTKRRTLGKAQGRAAISAEVARKQMVVWSGELQQGVDQLEVRREQARREERDVTFEAAVREYTVKKTRGKDGLPLKERTKADYLGMLRAGRETATGKPTRHGELYELASKPLSKITGEDVRSAYESARQRGQRRADYAMQVLRAVFNWYGVSVLGDPLSKNMPGRDRIVLKPTSGKPNPIPAERLGAWWRAACEAGRRGNAGHALSADFLRFMLLTGVRGGESAGSSYADGIRVRDVDVVAGRIRLLDTKNRTDHVLLLSRQALDIVKAHVSGKSDEDPLFPVRDPGKTLDAICEAAGIERRSPHKVRQTFASVAQELVSAYTLKRMVNHTPTGDVTGTSYVALGDVQLRAGWQAVADHIEELAANNQGVARAA
jgi:integrase